MKLLDHKVGTPLIFWAKLLSKMAVPIYIPIYSAQVFPLLLTLANDCYLCLFNKQLS
jgi:hypothetical protein